MIDNLHNGSPIYEVTDGGVVLTELLVREADLLPVVHGQVLRMQVSIEVGHGKQLVRELQPQVARGEELTHGSSEIGRYRTVCIWMYIFRLLMQH